VVVKELADSGALVAGGTAGIGLACAEALVQAGVPRLVVAGRNPERGARALERLRAAAPDAEVHFLSADCCDEASAAQAVEQAEELLGGTDVLITSIAPTYIKPELLLRVPVEEVRRWFVDQAFGPILMTRLVLPHMAGRGGGSIINVASDAGKTATPGETLIGASMAAVTMFSRAAALEAKRSGVRINVLTPSLVADTEGTERITAGETFSSKLFAKVATMAHLGVATAADQGAMAVFLAGPAAARLTGQAISINGGISAA
jgi:2-hydroxycyclohexanecarboxyl-CoA dehydrogenase